MARLPDSAGQVIAVVQSQDTGISLQRVVLRGDTAAAGENFISIATTDGSGEFPRPDSAVTKPTEGMITQELSDKFPSVDMRLSQTWNRNSFGPFGYAVGKAGTATCVYAWQYQPARTLGIFSGASAGAGPTSVRVRLCLGGVAETDIVAMINQLAVFPPGASMPYVMSGYSPGGGGGDALAATGYPAGFYVGPVHAPAKSATTSVRHERRHIRHAVLRRRHRAVAQTIEAEPAAAPNAVVVPLPANSAVKEPTLGATLVAPLQNGAAKARVAGADLPLPPSAAPAKPVAAVGGGTAPGGVPLPN